MSYTRIKETALIGGFRGSELHEAVAFNTWKKGARFRRLLRHSLDHRCISLFSLAVTFAVHCSSFGGAFATTLCFILVAHEAGHLVAGSFLKIPLPWPIFIPKVGALIVLNEETRTSYESAWLGISGPIAGLLATCSVDFLSFYTNSLELKFCATAGYAMHLFNLIPLGDLDGGRVASLIGRWLWIFGAALQLALLLYFRNLPWHTNLILLWVLWSGCMKMRCWILSKERDFSGLHGHGKTAKLRMASLYGLLILVCVLGLFSRPS
jgi:Zn-dependent protease